MKFAILGVLIILSIAFIVLLWKAAKAWRWYQLVAALFTFALAIAFIFPTAGVLKSRSEWHKKKEELEKRAEQVKQDNYAVKYGDPGEDNGATHLALKLAKIGRETGRRWRDMRMSGNAQGITLAAPAATAAPAIDGVPADAAGGDDAAPAPTPPSVPPENMIVYAFAEGNVNNMVLPVFYLGEFRVATSAANQITVVPTSQLEGPQIQRINSSQGRSWALYEMLPLDGHRPFVAEGSVESADNVFGRVDDTLVNALLKNKIPDETLQDYLRDGSRSSEEIGKWVKIEFTAAHKMKVDGSNQAGALEGDFFDESGRSIDGRLQRGADGFVSFKKEEQILVKDEAAKQLIDVDQVARLVDTYYLRPLNDYRFSLRKMRSRLSEAASRKTELEFEKKVLDDAIAATVSMLTSNQTAKLKLEQDLAQIQKEVKAIREYEATVAGEVKKTRQRLIYLYKDNIRLEEEIKRLHSTQN